MLRRLLFLHLFLCFGYCLPFTSSLLNESSANVQLTCSTTNTMSSNNGDRSSIRVAHLGNSIQYYNDCPRMLENLLRISHPQVKHDSCLRGGASLATLHRKGNGMAEKFRTPAARKSDGTYDIGAPTVHDLLSQNWDFVIMNDHTQAPAREEFKAKTKEALKSVYLPQLSDVHGALSPTVIFLMTAAYRTQVNESDDLGNFDEFTEKLRQGYSEYQEMVPGSKVAPVGLAYQYLRHHHPNIWEGLYANDDFHPSPHGTLLEAYVLFATMTELCPPSDYSLDWWNMARYMQPPNEEPLPLPTVEEATFLREIACKICGVTLDGTRRY